MDRQLLGVLKTTLQHDLGWNRENCGPCPLFVLRSRRRGYEVTVMKEMMNQAGLAGGPVRPPLPSLRPEEVKEVAIIIKDWESMLSHVVS
jgi:hypothetical protein